MPAAPADVNVEPTTEPELVIERTFDAPRDVVFRAWTDADALAQWWGPKGFALEVVRLDLRPGGTFHYSMKPPASQSSGGRRPPGGEQMWGRFVFREIVPPERLVWVNSFSDEQGGLGRNPWLPDFPPESLNVVTFAERDGKTTITLTSRPINCSEAQRAAFAGMLGSMQGGFKGTFEQLDAYLARQHQSAAG